MHHLGAHQSTQARLLLHQQPGPTEVECVERPASPPPRMRTGSVSMRDEVCPAVARRATQEFASLSAFLPMRVTCPSCQAAYNIDDQRIPPGGAKLKCSRCQALIPVRPGVPADPPPAMRFQEGAVPLPGLAGPVPPPPPPRTAAPPPPPVAAGRSPPPLGLPGLPRRPPRLGGATGGRVVHHRGHSAASDHATARAGALPVAPCCRNAAPNGRWCRCLPCLTWRGWGSRRR